MDLADALAFSHYATRLVCAQPALREELLATLEAPFAIDEARARLAALSDPAALARALRALRQRVMLHTLARDLTGRADLAEVFGVMSSFADLAITQALRVQHARLAESFGEPRAGEDGAPQALSVVALGKLGGGELNVSSDIDLVFVYGEEGETDGARRVANREFFDRLGRLAIGTLSETTADGFVFRVDMRLRPYGDSGPLTLPLTALEQYLVSQGRTWERYAWQKARVVCGDAGRALAELVTPFVYRKYLDFDAYEGLRDVHRQIREQAARASHGEDIKLGPGGIREIEFTVQAMQLVRGGREPALRLRSTVAALEAIGARALLPSQAVAELGEAYAWLRRLEHRLQYRDDQQTQRVPDDPAEREALARSMGEASGEALAGALAARRAHVDTWFGSVFGADEGRDGDDPAARFRGAWDAPDLASQAEALAAAGFEDPPTLVAALEALRRSSRYVALPESSKRRFDTLVPMLMAAAAASRTAAGPQATLLRLFALLEAVSRRSAYLALVIEHPPLLPRIAQLCGASPWVADYLTRHPMLLDELLDAPALLAEPDWTTWRSELAAELASRPGDVEWQMDALRHFQHAQTFRLLVQDLSGVLSIERLADHLSALADVVLDATLAACWRQLAGADAPAPAFAIVAYGKLGGKELGYASDLDLVFLYRIADDDPEHDARPQQYARLAQRINTWLTSTTAAGELYATDLRLRPDGAAGLACSSLESFRRYQCESAWTWEHQALTRARHCAGSAAIGEAFEAIRDEVLTTPRDLPTLAADVVAMRRRMHEGHPNRSALFDVKHDRGGMVDIEFVVQYLVLGHSHAHRELTRNAGNLALLDMAAAAGLVGATLASAAAEAYREYRRLQHAQRMAGAAEVRVDPAPHAARRAAVEALWTAVFGAPRDA